MGTMRALVDFLLITVAALALGACATTSTAALEAAQADPVEREFVANGVFSRGQAFRGERRFQQVCAACHRPVEVRRWFRASIYETVADMYSLIATTMPESDPGSLSASEYTDIVAYILSAQEFPAGPQELSQDRSVLENVFLRIP